MLKRKNPCGQKMRICLKCDRLFAPEHRFNRLCQNCARQNTEINYGFHGFNARVSSKKPLMP
jgi:NMD protein affecting ribosome stability and mRNA decay